MDLLVIGDVSIDQYMMIDHDSVKEMALNGKKELSFIHGSKIPITDFHINLAGNACHVSIGAKKLGLDTSVYSEVGNDENGNKFLAEFKRQGVNTDYFKLNDGVNTNIHAVLWYKDDRTILSYHKKESYELPFSELIKPRWIYYTSLGEGFLSFQEELLNYLNKNPDIGLAFNPGTIQLKNPSLLKPILERTNVIFVNKEEAQKISDTKEFKTLKNLHENLLSTGPNLTVITDGKNGSSTFDGKDYLEMPAIKVDKMVDKTGAGDSYAIGFLSALHYKKTLKEAMLWGSRNSAQIIQHMGCIDALLTKREIED